MEMKSLLNEYIVARVILIVTLLHDLLPEYSAVVGARSDHKTSIVMPPFASSNPACLACHCSPLMLHHAGFAC